MGNPFLELAKQESRSLVRAGSVSLVKKAAQAGYKIKPEVIVLGIGDVVSGTAKRIPTRVAKVLGQEPANPSRLSLISKRAASAIAGGLTLTGLTDLVWDFWHESSIGKEEREKLDQWLNSKGLRVGDPLSELSPEELTELATYIADARGGKVSAVDIADFIDGLTHKGLARAAGSRPAKNRRVYTSPASTVPGGGHVLNGSPNRAPKYHYTARDVVEFLMNYYGISPEGLANKIVAHKLLGTITVQDVEQYSRRPTPASGMALLDAMLTPSEDEDDDDADGDIGEQ